MRSMRILISLGLYLALSGCVIGSGPCLWLQVRHDFVGHVHLREFPRSDGIDTVPILILDKTQYMYAPPQSFHCLAANDLQLVGMAELPASIGENTHVTVDGTVYEGVADGQHTRFVINVVSILPTKPKP
jgi:hypothetical protein